MSEAARHDQTKLLKFYKCVDLAQQYIFIAFAMVQAIKNLKKETVKRLWINERLKK